jgi:diguanylate cyclase (GGDEF)-like protein
MSRYDSLTQLLNRPTLEREIDRELNRMLRYPGLSSLVFVDIDGFKLVNDELGHAAGDRVLFQLAEVLRANTRSVDLTGRYGGEEFVLFLPETNEPQAIYVVERMQQHFQIPTEATSGRSMTFSAGIAEAPRDGSDFDTLCRRADAAMYAAKRAGKAQVLPWRPGLSMASG